MGGQYTLAYLAPRGGGGGGYKLAHPARVGGGENTLAYISRGPNNTGGGGKYAGTPVVADLMLQMLIYHFIVC